MYSNLVSYVSHIMTTSTVFVKKNIVKMCIQHDNINAYRYYYLLFTRCLVQLTYNYYNYYILHM